MDRKLVEELVSGAISENEELFLIDLSFLPDNKIYVEVDGDKGVSLQECIRISRAVEHNLDREEEDFSLEVTSPDIANPLKVKRQYIKNLNRKLTVKVNDGTQIEGDLVNVSDEDIEIQWKSREPKPIGKGKVTVTKNAVVKFNNIVEAKVKIIF